LRRKRSFSYTPAYIIYKALREGTAALFLVSGRLGAGKTTYSLLILHDLYGDWDTVLDHFYYNPQDAFDKFEEFTRTCLEKKRFGKLTWLRDRITAVVFDDAGIWFSKYWHAVDPKVVLLINSIFDFIRSNVAGVIFTCPTEDILKELRLKSNYRVKVVKVRGHIREARGYFVDRTATGAAFVKKAFVDRFSVTDVPEWVLKEVTRRRFEAQLELYQAFKQRGIRAALSEELLTVEEEGGGSG